MLSTTTKIKKRQLYLVDSIETADLKNLAVTSKKIATAAVTETKIANGAVTDAKLATPKWNTSDVVNTASVVWTADNKVPTAAAVEARIVEKLGILSQALVYKGAHDASTALFPANAKVGFTYVATVAGTIDGVAIEIGDTLIATVESVGGFASTTSKADWVVIQRNIDGAVTNADASVVADSLAVFSGTTGKAITQLTFSGLVALDNGVPRAALASDLPSHSHVLSLSDGSNSGSVDLSTEVLKILGSGIATVSYDDVAKAFTVSVNETQLTVVNGTQTAGEYVAAISVNNHEITVTKGTLPADSNDFGKVSVNGAAGPEADAVHDTLEFQQGEGVTLTAAGKTITIAAPHANRASLDKIPANITAADANKVFRVNADGTLELVLLNYLEPSKYHVLVAPASIGGTGNRTVTLSHKVLDGKEMVMLNGQVLVRDVDYTIDNSGAQSIVTMLFDLVVTGPDEDVVRVTYFEA